MAIRFACSQCMSVFTVDDDKAGKTSKCPACGNRLLVPSGSPSELLADDSAPAAQVQDWHGDAELITDATVTSYPIIRPFYATRWFIALAMLGLIAGLGAAGRWYWKHRTQVQELQAVQAPETKPGGSANGQSPADFEKQILEHRWWSKKPGGEELERLLQLIVQTKEDYYVWINDVGETTITERRFTEVGRNMVNRPASMGKRAIWISIDGPAPYSRSKALAELRSALDWGLVQDGPGE